MRSLQPDAGAAANRTGTDIGIAGFDNAELIGQGGFGSVYRARQVALDRVVAVKVLSLPALTDDTRERFERECRAVGSLSAHPSIITVHDCGINEWGRPYIVMDHMARGSLADLVAAGGPLSWPDAIALIVKICGAVETAHAAGILHRDIKPENVLLSAYGEPTLADFGISALAMEHQTVSGAITASLTHAAPELLGGDPASRRSDIYAVASTLFTLLSGEPPFARKPDEPLQGVIARIVSESPADLRPRGIPGEVCVALERGLAKDPEHRPDSAGELGAVLRAAQELHGSPPVTMVVDPELAAETADRFSLLGHFAPGDASITGRTRARFRPILEPPKEEEPVARPWRKKPAAIAVAAGLMLAAAASAFAVTGPDREDEPPAGAVAQAPEEPEPAEPDAGRAPARGRDRERERKPRKPRNRGTRGSRGSTTDTSAAPSGSSFTAPTGSTIDTQPSGAAGGSEQPDGSRERDRDGDTEPDRQPPPPPPKPDDMLYELIHPDTGEHYMTINGTIAANMHGDGWRLKRVGYVYEPMQNIEGKTNQIGLDDGAAYVWAGYGAENEMTRKLYGVQSSSDVVYTTNFSYASDLAGDPGWGQPYDVGYVAAP